MLAATRDFVRRRAGGRCEYCLLPEANLEAKHHVEHIVARQHGGGDETGNLALACHYCNRHKGPNLSGIDPDTGVLVPLFNPRTDSWSAHFVFRGMRIEGTSPMGRATVNVLAMNDSRNLKVRESV